MHAGDTSVLEKSGFRADDTFQRLLLRFSEVAAHGAPALELIRLFCQATREFFRVDGVYFWRCLSPSELIGAEADGILATTFGGRRLKAVEGGIFAEAVRQHHTLCAKNPADRSAMPAEFKARTLMAAPLIISNQVVGIAVFTHSTPD